ncbi:hypothetical protein JMJ35_006824 [Cladonia borealis]|uniref:Uncharacterized protein n=1 Tax=Cladonia borealis TaxID=184061 RepID=A0AA39QW83_9LECA|nr:hypothetical protein JMJ35_006824 [Cladonia borealis]
MVRDSTIVQPTVDTQAIDVAGMKLPMASLGIQDMSRSHDMLQQGLTESQQHEIPHLAAGITEECDVDHSTTESERPQDTNEQLAAVEDTKVGEHLSLASSPDMEPNTEGDVDDTEMILQQVIQVIEDAVGDEETTHVLESETRMATSYPISSCSPPFRGNSQNNAA